MSLKYQVRLTYYRIQHFRHGETHRVGGPSCVYRVGHMYWKQYGKRHRVDGPAKIWGETVQYYLFDDFYAKEEYESKIRSY